MRAVRAIEFAAHDLFGSAHFSKDAEPAGKFFRLRIFRIFACNDRPEPAGFTRRGEEREHQNQPGYFLRSSRISQTEFAEFFLRALRLKSGAAPASPAIVIR